MGQLESSSTCLGDLDGASVFLFTFASTSTATYRAPGDWLVRQGRVHLANCSCDRLLDGRDGDFVQVWAPAVLSSRKNRPWRKSLLPWMRLFGVRGFHMRFPKLPSLAAPAISTRHFDSQLGCLVRQTRRRDKYCCRRRSHVVFIYSGSVCRTTQLYQNGHCRRRGYWRSLPHVLLPSARLPSLQVRELQRVSRYLSADTNAQH